MGGCYFGIMNDGMMYVVGVLFLNILHVRTKNYAACCSIKGSFRFVLKLYLYRGSGDFFDSGGREMWWGGGGIFF